MADRGLTLAWADRPVQLYGARSIGRVVGDLLIELPMCLMEAESAIGALVSADLTSLTDVEPSAALSHALVDRAEAHDPAQAEPARPTRVTRPAVGGHVDGPPLAGASTAWETHHRTVRPVSGPQRLPANRIGTSDSPSSPRWPHLSTATAATADPSPVRTADLVRMASPTQRTTTPAAPVGAAHRTDRGRAPAESNEDDSHVAGRSDRTSPEVEYSRPGARHRSEPTTLDERKRTSWDTAPLTPGDRPTPRAAVAASSGASATPAGQGLTALVEAWNRTTEADVPSDGNDRGSASSVPSPFALWGSDEIRSPAATDGSVGAVANAPQSASTNWDPVPPSDLDAEAMLLDVLTSALRTEARRYGIEPDIGVHR